MVSKQESMLKDGFQELKAVWSLQRLLPVPSWIMELEEPFLASRSVVDFGILETHL